MVRRHDGGLVVCSGTNHQTWLTRVCSDFGATLKTLEEAPKGIRAPTKEVYLTPCGEEFFDPILYSHHFRKCPKCKGARKVGVTAKLEPGVEHDLDGVILSLEVVHDQLNERLKSLDELITNLKSYRDAKGMMDELDTEVIMRVNAVKLLVSEGIIH